MFVCKDCVEKRAVEKLWVFDICFSVSFGKCELCNNKEGQECIDISSNCIRINNKGGIK